MAAGTEVWCWCDEGVGEALRCDRFEVERGKHGRPRETNRDGTVGQKVKSILTSQIFVHDTVLYWPAMGTLLVWPRSGCGAALDQEGGLCSRGAVRQHRRGAVRLYERSLFVFNSFVYLPQMHL